MQFEPVTLALLALNNHLNQSDVHVITWDPEYLERHLSRESDFRMVVPDVKPEFRLVGGSKGALGMHPAVYSRWQSPQGKCTVFQFRTTDFGLPEQARKEVISCQKCGGSAMKGCSCNVVIWSEQGRGYVLVAENCSVSDCIAPQ